MNLEQEIIALKKRNEKVELDKAWETSSTRKILISITTYLLISLFFFIGKFPDPFLSAIIPTFGFLLSTLSFSLVRNFWKKSMYKK